MDETAGGCTNFISWRHNNQWLLNISRPATKLIIKLTQPDARLTTGNGRHYSNAIGFYILKGNSEPADMKRRKLILKDGDEEDGGDFVFCKEPRYSRQVVAEYTFEKASPTPYVLLPFIFEPGREALFKLTILSDDRDDDGQPDFGFNEVKPEEDWKRTTLLDSWSTGGAGNVLGEDDSAGGPVDGSAGVGGVDPLWCKGWQFQITLYERTRCFLFLEMRDVKTDMRDQEGLQTEPDYPTVGFVVCEGRGDHVKLEGMVPPKVLHVAPLKRGDGVYLELGWLEPTEDKYIVIPYTDKPRVEHKYVLTLYTDQDHKFEKLIPRPCIVDCPICTNPTSLYHIFSILDGMESSCRLVMKKEQALVATGGALAYAERGGGVGLPLAPGGAAAAAAAKRAFMAADTDGDGKVDAKELAVFRKHFQQADTDGDGTISAAELDAYTKKVQEHAEAQHAQFSQMLEAMLAERTQIQHELDAAMAELRELEGGCGPSQSHVRGDPSKSSMCLVM